MITEYKVPFRQVYTLTLRDWLKQTFWCLVVIKVFPFLIDLESDALKGSYVDNPQAFYEQYEWLIYEANRLPRKLLREDAEDYPKE